MAAVKLTVHISGTRNGEDWPAPGTVVDLPDEEAASLVAHGLAVETDDEERATSPEAEVETATRKPRAARKADEA
jgi:hypothetical protein